MRRQLRAPRLSFHRKVDIGYQGIFLLAMTLHPEVARLAQQELDEVLGGERLAEPSDKPRLPYISAVMKEVLAVETAYSPRYGPPVTFCCAGIGLNHHLQGLHVG
jgi:hypothetical protein